MLSFAALRLGTTGTESPEWQKEKKHNLPLRSAAPPLMMRATITAPVASSRLMVAPWSAGRRIWSLTAKSKGLVPRSLLHSHPSQLTRGSLFFTSLTIFTDSSSSSSSMSSGSGGSTGSKFFWATVSCTERTAWWDRKQTRWDYSADAELLGCQNLQTASEMKLQSDVRANKMCDREKGQRECPPCLPWDVVTSAGAAAPSPRCSSVRSAAPLPPADHNTNMNRVPWPGANLCTCMSVMLRFTVE